MAKPSTTRSPSRTKISVPDSADSDDAERKYRAPALEKGLDVLELMAKEGAPLTTSQIAAQLGRSVSELFRMVLTLEHRGYIAPSDNSEGYELTNHLFTLGMAQSPTRSLLEIALPVMKSLSRTVGQSCHLVAPSGDQMVVVARIESPRDLGFAVRLGYRRRMVESASGLLFYGAYSEAERESWRPELEKGVSKAHWQRFEADAKEAVARGYVRRPSDFVEGVTDLACPVMSREGMVAALIVPYILCNPPQCDQEEVLQHLQQATAKIGGQLVGI